MTKSNRFCPQSTAKTLITDETANTSPKQEQSIDVQIEEYESESDRVRLLLQDAIANAEKAENTNVEQKSKVMRSISRQFTNLRTYG